METTLTVQEQLIDACSHENRSCTDIHLSDGRTVACCCDCWNAGVKARKASVRKGGDAARAAGIEFWSKRGVAVGDRVYRIAAHALVPNGIRIDGIAKVGVCGAYVSSRAQRGQLVAEGWVKA